MNRNEFEQRIRDVFGNRLIGFSSSEEHTQLIVDVISVLANKNITVSCAVAILEDSAKIIPRITDC